jgi:Zn finger protein HypA/HybF involved in hydrogenase expression
MQNNTKYGCPKCKSTEGFSEHNVVHADYPFARFEENEVVPGDAYADSDTYGTAEICWESAEIVEDDPARYKCDNCEHTFYAPEEIEVEQVSR